MEYSNTIKGIFIKRLNRFIAEVYINGNIENVHVKNTGRCLELLQEKALVCLSDEQKNNPLRKTKYDLISVYKPKIGWINIDSQAPNKIVHEWLKNNNKFDLIKSEYTYNKSRIDFLIKEKNSNYSKILLEIKGCTLEIDGIGYFPDAPTERGTKHLKELTSCIHNGYKAIIGFVIQINGIKEVRPNIKTDKKFTNAFYNALKAGVKVLFIYCEVTENTIKVIGHNFLNNNNTL
ncbi:MAG: DNA/RNA nuclease SfsA [Succinivibrionaceae bacterium]